MSKQAATEFEVKSGAKIPLFQPGKRGPKIFSASDMNNLVKVLNAFLNLKLIRGESDSFEISESNAILKLKSGDGTGGTTLSMFKLATPTAERQKVVEDDYVICRTWDGTTLGDTDVKVSKDYALRCSLTGETVMGVEYDYTYAADSEDASTYPQGKVRTVTDPDNFTEDQRVIRPWVPGEVIWAAKCSTGVTVDSVPVEWLEIKPCRQWAKIL